MLSADWPDSQPPSQLGTSLAVRTRFFRWLASTLSDHNLLTLKSNVFVFDDVQYFQLTA